MAEFDGRVFVWGRGTLLVFDGQAFVPFTPDARLDPQEDVIAVAAQAGKLQLLVFEDGMGALAYFDGLGWVPIQEEHVMHGPLADMDVRSGSPLVVSRSGAAYRLDARRPRQLLWDTDAHAFRTEIGGRRPFHSVREIDGGALVGTDGGVIHVRPPQEPVFYGAAKVREPVRLVRVGPAGAAEEGIVALSGGNAWLWHEGRMDVIDLSDW
jgi:hypothetical protein